QEKIREKTEILGIAESVIFAGLQKEPAPFYSAMDVFAFPSLWEGLPLTLVEAQYSGLPCVVSENVTKEITISEYYVPIKVFCLKIWAKTLENKFTTNRMFTVNSSNFDISRTFGHLKKIYEE
ncbi:glycosyltransferase, partial [bacterium]|nr:glycosyltransferase [bacterium]